MKYEYKMTRVKATGPGLFSRTPTEGNIERELRQQSSAGWRLVQVLTVGLLFRKTWLVLERSVDKSSQ
jgi:hypothetical protein